jgi:hypothetical protein
MINVDCNDSISLQIKDETPLNTQQLTQDLKNEVDLLLKKVEYQEQYIDQLQHMLLEARRHRFGVKSEKFDDQFQGKLDFGDNNADCQIAPNELPETQVPAHKRKKKLKSSKVLPRRIVIIPVDEKDKQCA